MKTRISFVSNSSSSSFILVFRDDAKFNLVNPNTGDDSGVRITVDDLKDMIESCEYVHSESSRIKASGVENTIDCLAEEATEEADYDYYPGNTRRKRLESARVEMRGIIEKEMKSGGFNDAVVVKISYDDKFIRNLIDGFVKSKQMKYISWKWYDDPTTEEEQSTSVD